MTVNIDMNDVVLETKRLILRAWENSDLDDFYEYAVLMELVKWLVGYIIIQKENPK